MTFENAYDKISIRRNFRTAKLFYGEISVRPNIRTAKIPTAIFPYDEVSLYDEISLRRNFLTAKFPTAKFPTAKFPNAGQKTFKLCYSIAFIDNITGTTSLAASTPPSSLSASPLPVSLRWTYEHSTAGSTPSRIIHRKTFQLSYKTEVYFPFTSFPTDLTLDFFSE